MTANQIAFYQAQEQRRSNLAKEGLTSQAQTETARHNLQSEYINYAQLGEQARHNQVVEGTDWYKATSLAQLQKAQSDKATSEVGVSARQADEAARHNLYTEINERARTAETQRHNEATEKIDTAKAVTGGISALGTLLRGAGSLGALLGG